MEKEEKKPSKKKKKISKKKLSKLLSNIIILGILIIGIILFTSSAINLYQWYRDSKNIEKVTDMINSNVTVQEVVEEENVEIIEQPQEIEEENPYWDYIKMSLIDVDFTELENINPDTKGWIQVNGTNINYPFVQTTDNDYYLFHAFDKSKNNAGWVFLDYRNDIENLQKNTILYAHGRWDKTMFGSLKDLLKSNWYKNSDNHIIKLSTKSQNTLWQVFSVYHIPTTSDYIQVSFNTPQEFVDFAKMLQDRSIYKFPTTVNENDKILTLSTCYGEKEKMVMHAKLIKVQNK